MAKNGEAVDAAGRPLLTPDEIERLERFYGAVDPATRQVKIRRLDRPAELRLRRPDLRSRAAAMGQRKRAGPARLHLGVGLGPRRVADRIPVPQSRAPHPVHQQRRAAPDADRHLRAIEEEQGAFRGPGRPEDQDRAGAGGRERQQAGTQATAPRAALLMICETRAMKRDDFWRQDDEAIRRTMILRRGAFARCLPYVVDSRCPRRRNSGSTSAASRSVSTSTADIAAHRRGRRQRAAARGGEQSTMRERRPASPTRSSASQGAPSSAEQTRVLQRIASSVAVYRRRLHQGPQRGRPADASRTTAIATTR